MDTDPTQTKAMELEVIEAKENNDDRDLARLGKSPVLKVRCPLFSARNAVCFVPNDFGSGILASCQY